MSRKQLPSYYALGLDISGRNCGAFSLEVGLNSYKAETWDLGEISPDWDQMDRLHNLSSRLISTCLERRPTIVVIEDYAYNMPFRAAMQGEVGGMAKYTCKFLLTKRPRIIPVAPTSVKKFMADFGGAKKKEMIACVNRLGFKVETEHEADAAALAFIGIYMIRNNKMLNEYQKGLITKLNNEHP